MVHISEPVGIDPRHQRGHLAQLGEILPVEHDPARAGHRDEVDEQVGRPTRGVEPDDAVDEGALVEDVADRGVVVAQGAEAQRALGAFAGQRVAQPGVGRHEAGAGQVQPHELHQHLVGVGRAVEGAGARPVIGRHLGGHERVAPDLAGGELLAHLGLLVIAEAALHRPGGHEDGRQVAKGLRRDHQPRHDLVADPEEHRGIKRVVAERHRGRERDHVAREERQLHPGLALGDAVAHGRNPARDLRRAARLARGRADQLGKPLERLMRREHVVIGGDDREVAGAGVGQPRLVRAGGGVGMRLPAARQMRPRGPLRPRRGHRFEVPRARRLAAGYDPVR